jgi:hypothetical protein|tara:strand:+ start:5265 stop:5543 length:279 start_codon:yes stop_codon:yes gene_type:complete
VEKPRAGVVVMTTGNVIADGAKGNGRTDEIVTGTGAGGMMDGVPVTAGVKAGATGERGFRKVGGVATTTTGTVRGSAKRSRHRRVLRQQSCR